MVKCHSRDLLQGARQLQGGPRRWRHRTHTDGWMKRHLAAHLPTEHQHSSSLILLQHLSKFPPFAIAGKFLLRVTWRQVLPERSRRKRRKPKRRFLFFLQCHHYDYSLEMDNAKLMTFDMFDK